MCTELYRKVPKSVQSVMMFDVPKHVPKCTEMYRFVPMTDLSDVPKRTERVYKPFGFRYKSRFGTCGRVFECFLGELRWDQKR